MGWSALGVSVVLLALSVWVLARLRWIQSRPIATCIVLSVLAHGLLVFGAYLTRMLDAPPLPGDNSIRIRLSDTSPDASPLEQTTNDEPWGKLAVEPALLPQPTPVPRAKLKPLPRAAESVAPVEEAVVPPRPAERLVKQPTTITAPPQKMPAPAASDLVKLDRAASPSASSAGRPTPQPTPTPQPLPPRTTTNDLALSTPVDSDWKSAVPEAQSPANGWRSAAQPDKPPARASGRLTDKYQARIAEDRDEIVRRRGGSADTEAAVRGALQWLASHQSEEGNWDASQYDGGQGQLVDGHFRGPAGLEADTGITGLALLALLGAGNTHSQGEHRATVGKGLEYLLRSQASDGNLCGLATNYARMYCHGIATLAISEALAMSQDDRLRPFVRRAIDFSIASQHPVTGGWRYQPGDQGDTSQLGWQIMAFTTAEDAGIDLPPAVTAGAQRFLGSVSYGVHRGLASYRPGMGISHSMTAEALACRIFLGISHPNLEDEAARFIRQRLPGTSRPNLYYWYYATLGLSQTDSAYWQEWNAALTRELLQSQEQKGKNSGSWSPDTVWGGHGGRVYSTAMASLCLEVYYRYPLRQRNSTP